MKKLKLLPLLFLLCLCACLLIGCGAGEEQETANESELVYTAAFQSAERSAATSVTEILWAETSSAESSLSLSAERAAMTRS